MDLINISQVSKTFGDHGKKINVLNDVNLKVEKSKSISIVGRSGSGKSTLLSILGGLDRPDSGSISISGVEIQSLTQKELTEYRSKNIGIIFQHFHLLDHLTALENVALALEITNKKLSYEEVEKEASHILELVGLSSRMGHFSSQLSGGEKQRVAIARALVVGPSILLADEPSGSLDQETGREVMKLIFKLSKEKQTTLILVTHDNELASFCDEKWTLNKGSLSQCS